MAFDLWLTSNSPGEVTTWVGGVVPWLRKLRPEWRIRVALVPCPYASGAEKAVAQAIEGVSEVLSPGETSAWYFGLRKAGWPAAPEGGVVFLGGDPWHALLLGKKLGYPVHGYFERPSFWSRWFDRVMLAYESDRRRADEVVVGNLMVDRVSWNASPTGDGVRCIAIFPGSRPWQARLAMGPMLSAAERLKQRLGEGVEFVLMRSPFLKTEQLEYALRHPFKLGLPVPQAQVFEDRIELASGLVVPLRAGGKNLDGIDLAMTMPGTNTAELACAGVPFVVALHALAYIGGGGLSGILERLPLPNAWKARRRARKHRRMRFTALPNQKAGAAVCPELVLSDSLEPLVQQLADWVEDPAEVDRMRSALHGIMGQSGATQRLAQQLIGELERGGC